jgi:3',5'-nucleoside bisphosphate phosphatase
MTAFDSDCIDLHLHSTLSDGLFAPSEVVGLLASAGISVACFTDHNCVHPHYAALQDYARQRHDVLLPFPGAEVTVVYIDPAGRDRAYVLHVLAYGDGVLDPRFQQWLNQANIRRRDYIFSVYRTLVGDGFELAPFDELYRTRDPADGLDCEQMLCSRTPLARAMAKLLGVSPEEARDGYVPPQPMQPIIQPMGVNDYDRLDVFDLLDWAERLGIVLIVAHPGRVRDHSTGGTGGFDDQLEAIVELVERGVDGVEVSHRRNSGLHMAQLRDLARSMNLIATGGSDFHGQAECVLGVNATSRDEFERLRGRIAEKRRNACFHGGVDGSVML